MPAERPGTHDADTARIMQRHTGTHRVRSQGGNLPKHWETAISKTTGKMYYVNMITGESQYELPDASQL